VVLGVVVAFDAASATIVDPFMTTPTVAAGLWISLGRCTEFSAFPFRSAVHLPDGLLAAVG
jgi:hypothetical protein